MKENWELLQRLFDETADLEPEPRERWLKRRLGEGNALVREVEDLIRADRDAWRTVDELERPGALGLEPEASRDDGAALVGESIGSYRIEALLSSGGMGSVYRATWSKGGVERRVAVKVLKRGLDTDALLSRFRREQRSLAALQHEHIVAFLDSGALPDGRPYLVMEYVDGGPLTTWCDERSLGARARLALFLRVLSAVRHAHQSLIVHRDLKPSNVLVTSSGTPKLLDFGIAALLDDEGRSRTTIPGTPAPCTPDYASPEQLRGEPVTTASDVYSLGAILYELLVGRPLVEQRTLRLLRGDLDRIVRKATHPEVRSRYASVERFADDVESYLAGRPVTARPATFGYRARCFVTANRKKIAAGAALLLALIAALVGAEVGRQRALADASRGWGAHIEAKIAARELADLLSASVLAGDRWLAVASETEAALPRSLAGHLEAEALVRLALAQLYVAKEVPLRAQPHLQRVLEIAAIPGSGVGPAEAGRARELKDRAEAIAR